MEGPDADAHPHDRSPFPQVVWHAFRYPCDVRTVIGLLCASLFLHVVFAARRIQAIRSFGIAGDLLLVVVFGAVVAAILYLAVALCRITCRIAGP